MRDDAAYAALRFLVGQLEAGDWRDRHGHRIELNQAYVEARELVAVNAALRERGPPWTPEPERL